MQVDAGKTFGMLANCLLPFDPSKEKIIFYREQKGDKCFLCALGKSDLSIWQLCRKFFGSKDFNEKIVVELVETALTQLPPLSPLTNPEMVYNVKGWYRYLKLRAELKQGKKPDPAFEQKIQNIFQRLYPVPPASRRPPSLPPPDSTCTPFPHQEPLLPKGMVQKEALTLHPLDPAKGRGIINQGNWCYLDAFVQAAGASSRFREMVESSIEKVNERLSKLDDEIGSLKEESQAFLKKIPLSAEEIKQFADQIVALENKSLHNLSCAEHAEIEKKLHQIKLPKGISVKDIKEASEILKNLHILETTKSTIVAAKNRAEALILLFDTLNKPDPDGTFSPLSEDSELNNFVHTFELTGSFFHENLISHAQQDPAELVNALCFKDLLDGEKHLFLEKSLRQKGVQTEDVHIDAIDNPKEYDFFEALALPDPLPKLVSLPQIFNGVWDTYSVEKDKKEISNQKGNKALFDGDNGVVRKQKFLSAIHADIPIQRSVCLAGEAPPCLPLIIKRFDDKGNKRRFHMFTPFRLEVPFADKRPPAVYLLRSALIHIGDSISSGHCVSYITDLNSVNPISGQPTHFVCKNDSRVYPATATTAHDGIQENGYILFYDRVDQS